MYSQSFSPQNLYLHMTQTERRNSTLDKEELIKEIGVCIGDSIAKGEWQFKIKTVDGLYLNGQPKGTMEYLCQDLVFRKLHRNIKRVYGVEQGNRDRIIKQIVTLLNEDVVGKFVIRLDVRHFYEAIERVRLLERFQDDGRLSYQSVCLLQNLFAQPVIAAVKGLPRGLSVSAVMSELYMKYFDLEIRRMQGVYYYARFVDDIIVFCADQKSQAMIWDMIPDSLSRINLQLNPDKSYKWDDQHGGKELTYLGYTFVPQRGKRVKVVMAEKKVNTIKTRITKAFVRYAVDGNFDMLKTRIKFLTGNFMLHNHSTLLPVKVGIHYNYNMVTDTEVLYNLDKYYQQILHCRTGRLGSQLDIKLSTVQRKELAKYSFVFGFERRVSHSFSSTTLASIKSCWR